MTRECQNCKILFEITEDDSSFYERMKVPPPTWCPECRMIRRMVFRNQRTLYKRRVVGVEEEVFSLFPLSAPFPVYYQKNWLSAEEDAIKYGRPYDFNKPFFSQLRELMNVVPWQHAYNQNAVDSEYCSNALDLRRCYLMFNSGMSENCMYGSDVLKSADSLDLSDVIDVRLSYELFHSEKCHRCFFSAELLACTNVFFSYDLTNCHDCIGCVGLRHKQYYIFNVQYTREEYLEKLEGFNFGSYRSVVETSGKFEKHRRGYPVKFMHGYQNVNTTGDYLENSKDTRVSFMSRDLDNCAYCQMILFTPGRDSYDLTISGGEQCYEISIGGGYHIFFSWLVGVGPQHSDVAYSMNCFNTSNLFGCVGIRNRRYCILNKQYHPEEYNALLPRIIQHMNDMPYIDAKGRTYRYGEFFPIEFSPYPYNETIAQEFFPLTKEKALEQGFTWDDRMSIQEATIASDDLADHIEDIPDSMAEEIIGCAHNGECLQQCTVAFRVTLRELKFYRKMKLPLPRLCHNCRHFERIKQRNPFKLWHRKCTCAGEKSDSGVYANKTSHLHKVTHCPNEFETSYASNRPEIVYCEACYQSEIQ